MSKSYSVRDFGAKGDGQTLDTRAIQSAIDACAAEGGGTVEVGPGRYVSRTLELRSNITLRLDSGATLCCDPHPGEGVFRDALVAARGCHDVRVIGGGCLYGNDEAFWVPKTAAEIAKFPNYPILYSAVAEKPRPVMLLFEDCEYVTVEGISIQASPSYAAWLKRCTHADFRGASVRNRGDGPNTDGFHFGSCAYVTVVGCSFVCGDDCIAIDSCEGGDARHFAISGCTFDSTVNAFRIYTGIDHRYDPSYRHDVSDIVASACTANASGVFNLTAERGVVSNVVMTGFAIRADCRRRGNWAFLMTNDGVIRDCVFSHIVAEHNGAISLVGEEGNTIRNVTFDTVKTRVHPLQKEYGMDLPERIGERYYIHNRAPQNVYLRHCEDIELRNFRLDWEESDEVPEAFPAAKLDRCQNVALDGFRAAAYHSDGPAVQILP